MENYKVKVGSEAESKEAQELFVALGGEVRLDDRVGIVCLTEGKIYTDDIKFYDAYGDCKELTIPQLRGMVVLKRNDVSDATHTDGHYSFYVGKDKNYFFSSCDKAWRGTWKNVEILKPIEKPMKEYLNKLEDGTYKLVLLDSGADGVDGLIEIPEGSMFATGSDVIFRKNNYIFDDGAWELTDVTIDNANFYGLNITWQRETLNDKVASAEVARQEFIGAPFSDLPEVNSEAVDDFVELNVEQTLSDRESTYGSFKDVAVTTRNIMNCIDVDSMNAVQQEALHMICSKLARIANGDPNHVDSWHDIAGYASLVVKDINGNP